MTHTDAEKFDEASRELAQRIRAYPRMIVEGKITKDEAHRRMALMQSIASDYEQRVKHPSRL